MSKDARIRELEKRVAQLQALVERLLDQNKRQSDEIARLKKTSKTSSKPPSSDIVSGDGTKPRKKRKIGGQKGHPRACRQAFDAEQIDEVIVCEWPSQATPPNPHLWQPLEDFHVVQQVELRDDPLIVTEYRFRKYRHLQTGRVIHAPVPQYLQKQGLFGPRLRALTATLKSELHASYRGIARLYDDALGLEISTGYLAKVIDQTADALAAPYDQMHAALVAQPVLHLDETGHPQCGKRLWTWCAIADQYSVFKIVASRGAKVIESMLGHGYSGVVCSDFYNAYRKFVKDTKAAEGGGGAEASYCWAHLIREVRYLTTLSDPVVVRWARALLGEIKRLFKAYHRQGERAQRNAKRRILKRVGHPPRRREAQKLASRIRKYKTAYFLFLEREEVEPTNNIAERALRHAVLTRKMTQGTRGEAGVRWCERIWSVRETCRQQQRSFFDYLAQAINEHTRGGQIPLLLG